MKNVTVGTYRKDKLYPRVVWAVASLLRDLDEISPVAVFMRTGNLSSKDYEAWRRGQVPCLERVFQGNLSKANRYLRILRFHVHDLNMVPSQHTYRQYGRKRILRFSLSGDAGVEQAYARHFRWNQSKEKKQAYIEQALSENIVAEATSKIALFQDPVSPPRDQI
ncbi:MAG: hypothetical protein EA399_03090 [Desulfovibrionales bacterium]|nr:MAG: hypothetical protein EA399_03090 [Desulfovibrionales bacterium]